MLTSAGAWAEFAENYRGRLMPGMLADFAVLSQDVCQVPEEQIPGTRKPAHGDRRQYSAYRADRILKRPSGREASALALAAFPKSLFAFYLRRSTSDAHDSVSAVLAYAGAKSVNTQVDALIATGGPWPASLRRDELVRSTRGSEFYM